MHKHVNRPETFHELVEKVQSHGILVFGLFIFGFDHDDPSVFDETAQFNIDAGYDMSAYSVMTPYPGTLTWYQMEKAGRVVSYDWDKYDQGHIVFRPENLTPEQLREGHMHAYRKFYSLSSMAKRFPIRGTRSRLHWSLYNMFFRKGEVTGRDIDNAVAEATLPPTHIPVPPIMPLKREWREAVLEGMGEAAESPESNVA